MSTIIRSRCAAITRSPIRIASRAAISSHGQVPRHSLTQKNVLAQTSGGNWYNESVSITDTHTFTPNLVNQALFSFNHTDGAFVPIQPTRASSDLGAKYSNAAIYKWQIAVSGYFSIDTADTNNFPRRERQFVDTRALDARQAPDHVRRRLQPWTQRRDQQFPRQWAVGVWRDLAVHKRRIGRLHHWPVQHPDARRRRIQEHQRDPLGMFFQDSIKLTRRFTIDAGVRWEPFFPFTDDNGKLAVWSPGREVHTLSRMRRWACFMSAIPALPTPAIPPTWRNFAPRLGFAWDVMGDGKTSRTWRLRSLLRLSEFAQHQFPSRSGAVRNRAHHLWDHDQQLHGSLRGYD